ncbi:MAG: FecR domain-containing protein, partial [Spirochaetaceae bacterium]
MKRRRLFLTALVLLVATGAVAQQAAVFENVSGKVEIRPPGGAWRTAEEGEQIPLNATVSTGFGSEATLALGRSTVTMKALSRMTVEELVEREGVSQSSTRVNVGRVSARVRSAEGVRTDFQIRGPISTASVRGTGFDFDTVRLFVTENEVELTNLLGQRR